MFRKVYTLQKVLVLLLILQFGHNGFSQDSLRILFVGNSYTYFWNLPQNVEAVASGNDLAWKVRQSTAGGASWKDHWDGEKELKTREVISRGNWDIVVLQNHSMSTIENPDEFTEYGNKLIDLVKSKGAEPILYVTWSREFNPTTQSTILNKYNELAKSAGIKTIPVGPVWEHIRSWRPGIELYDADQSHPAPLGTYVNTCLFYRTLSGDTHNRVPDRITTTDRNGEKLYLMIVPPDDANFIQDAIDHFYNEWDR